MWFSDMLCNLHVWYLQSEVLYNLSSSHSKSQLSDSLLHRLCFSFFLYTWNWKGYHTKKKKKTLRIPSLDISRPLMSTHITTIIWALQWWLPYEENTMLIQLRILWSKSDSPYFLFFIYFFFIFHSDRYVRLVAQHQKQQSLMLIMELDLW